MLSPAEPLPASTLVSRPVGRRWWAMGAVLAIAGLAALAVVFWPRTPKGPRELTPGKWHNVLDRPPVPLLWPAGAFPPQFDDNQQQLLVNCDSPALLRLGTIPDGVHYKIEIGFRQPRWIGGVGLFFGYQQRADRTTFQQILLVPAGSNKSQFRLSRSRGEMTVIDGEPFPMIHGLFTQDVRPLGPQESRLEIEVGKAGPLHRVRWNGDELHTLTHPQAAESTRDCSYHGDFGIAMEKSSAVITTARVLVFEKGN
jgi:hypothetical protein